MRLSIGLFLMLVGGGIMLAGIFLALRSFVGLYQGVLNDPMGDNQPVGGPEPGDVAQHGMYRGVIFGARHPPLPHRHHHGQGRDRPQDHPRPTPPGRAGRAERPPCLTPLALYANLALVKAHQADEFGNLVYRKTARNFNPMMATAAAFVVAEVEEVVPLGSLDPDAIHTPGSFVDRVVRTVSEKRIEQRTIRA